MTRRKQLRLSLSEVRNKYNVNFEKLLKSVGKRFHARRLDREIKLHNKELDLMRQLGISTSTPCMIDAKKTVTCNECTGYYKSIKERRIPQRVSLDKAHRNRWRNGRKKPKYIYPTVCVEVKPGTVGAHFCQLKNPL